MSDKIYITYDENGIPIGVGDATETAEVQRRLFLDLLDLIGDESPEWSDIVPHLKAVPDSMMMPVLSVTIAQLLIMVSAPYDFLEKHGIDSREALRERWHKIIGDLDGGGDDE